MPDPKGKMKRSTEPKDAYQSLFEPGFEIAAWCRDKNAETPPEQVHFIVHWPVDFDDLPPLAIRFKGPDTLGFFIEELTRYRRKVWPHCELIEGEINLNLILKALQDQPDQEPRPGLDELIEKTHELKPQGKLHLFGKDWNYTTDGTK